MKELDYNRLLRIQETIVDLTANCYSKLIVKYEDSRVVVETIKAWADEFEDWWEGMSDDDRDRIDYLEAIDDFSERHLRAELEDDKSAREKVAMLNPKIKSL